MIASHKLNVPKNGAKRTFLDGTRRAILWVSADDETSRADPEK